MLVLVQFDDEVVVGVQSFFCLVVPKQEGVGPAQLQLYLVAVVELVELLLAQDLLQHE